MASRFSAVRSCLPYLELDHLHRQFKLDEPWDGPTNSRLITQMPKVFAHPNDAEGAARGLTCFRVFTGPHTPFPDPVLPFEAYRSGCRFPMSFRRTGPRIRSWLSGGGHRAVDQTRRIALRSAEAAAEARRAYQPGACVAMADGSVFYLPPTLSDATLRSAITLDDGMPLGVDWPVVRLTRQGVRLAPGHGASRIAARGFPHQHRRHQPQPQRGAATPRGCAVA